MKQSWQMSSWYSKAVFHPVVMYLKHERCRQNIMVAPEAYQIFIGKTHPAIELLPHIERSMILYTAGNRPFSIP